MSESSLFVTRVTTSPKVRVIGRKMNNNTMPHHVEVERGVESGRGVEVVVVAHPQAAVAGALSQRHYCVGVFLFVRLHFRSEQLGIDDLLEMLICCCEVEKIRQLEVRGHFAVDFGGQVGEQHGSLSVEEINTAQTGIAVVADLLGNSSY
jgi:hypothetical protein